MKEVLVFGGAGYISSNMVKMPAKSGFDVMVFDNLSTGYKSLVKYVKLVVGYLADRPLLEKLFSKRDFQDG